MLVLEKVINVLETIKEFEKANKVKIKYTIGERRKGDVEKIFSDNTLIKNKLKWKAEKFKTSLCRCVELGAK